MYAANLWWYDMTFIRDPINYLQMLGWIVNDVFLFVRLCRQVEREKSTIYYYYYSLSIYLHTEKWKYASAKGEEIMPAKLLLSWVKLAPISNTSFSLAESQSKLKVFSLGWRRGCNNKLFAVGWK